MVDFATSATAEGKLSVARDRGEPVPEGLLVDPVGDDSTDPEDFYRGGALLTFGGHKGYGLSAAFDLVAGLLSGTGSASDPAYAGRFRDRPDRPRRRGVRRPRRRSRPRSRRFRKRVHASTPRSDGVPVLVPGEPEWQAYQQARATASPSPTAVADLDHLAATLDVPTLTTHAHTQEEA